MISFFEAVANLYSAGWIKVGMMKVGGVQFGMADDVKNRARYILVSEPFVKFGLLLEGHGEG